MKEIDPDEVINETIRNYLHSKLIEEVYLEMNPGEVQDHDSSKNSVNKVRETNAKFEQEKPRALRRKVLS